MGYNSYNIDKINWEIIIMKCPKCGGQMSHYISSSGTAVKTIGKTGIGTLIGGAIGSIAGPVGTVIGAGLGASVGSRKSKNESRYRECLKCDYVEWEKED